LARYASCLPTLSSLNAAALIPLLALVLASSPAQAQNVALAFNSVGLSSLTYNGTQFLAYGDLRLDQIELLNSTGSITLGSTTSSVTVDTNAGTQTRTYPWGTIVEAYAATQNRLNLTLTVTNNSGLTIKGIWIEALGMSFPATPQEFLPNMYPLLVNTIGSPAVQSMSYGSGVMVVADSDVTLPLQLGFPWALSSANLTFPLTVNTDTVFEYPNSEPAINRPIAAGASDTYHLSLRFGPAGSTSLSLAGDIYKAFAAAFPPSPTFIWPDRRAIGMLFLAPTTDAGWPTNPRGWFSDPTVDVTTPQGIASFQAEVLSFAKSAVSILQNMNAQAMITWDIEGEQYPMPTTYVGDPRLLPTLAPEMDPIADQYFQTFVKAGFRIGLVLRPQLIAFTAGVPQQNPLADPTQNLIAKVQYAKQRWGIKLFYVDSNVISNTNPNPIAPTIFETLQAMFPDSLFIPEHSVPQYSAYTAPYLELNQGYTGTAPTVRAMYPNAFTVLNVENGPLSPDFNLVASSVDQGDTLLYRSWFDDEPTNTIVQQIYATLPPVVISVAPSSTSLGAFQAQQFEANVTGTSYQQVNWSVKGPGSISPSGLYSAPASITSKETVTVTATSADAPTKTATATITLYPPVATKDPPRREGSRRP